MVINKILPPWLFTHLVRPVNKLLSLMGECQVRVGLLTLVASRVLPLLATMSNPLPSLEVVGQGLMRRLVLINCLHTRPKGWFTVRPLSRWPSLGKKGRYIFHIFPRGPPACRIKIIYKLEALSCITNILGRYILSLVNRLWQGLSISDHMRRGVSINVELMLTRRWVSLLGSTIILLC
jgi:hypothetical protein